MRGELLCRNRFGMLQSRRFRARVEEVRRNSGRSTCDAGSALRRRLHRTKATGITTAWCFLADTPNRTSRDENPLNDVFTQAAISKVCLHSRKWAKVA